MKLIRNIALSAMILLSAVACKDDSPQGTKVQDGAAYITMPEGYAKMSDKLLKTKFPQQTPKEGYATADTTSSFVFTLTDNNVSEEGLGTLKDMMKVQFDDFDPEITETVIDGRKSIVIKVTTPASDGEVNNIMLFTSIDGKMFLASFNCMSKDKEKFYSQGEKAMMSIKWG
ncbi:hypothetical protein [Buttiauxella sp. A111]|uniref:hypothetical protein n=1 Tax=Buttiauxella sp. A111 TaxID=2563088 RepID=UPI0010DF9105|nr:hypothetical protein [Buttiauxella sp. A111]GDX03842.1 hypothetical protein BSPA111_00010 [Buttiauxella sp. A111]